MTAAPEGAVRRRGPSSRIARHQVGTDDRLAAAQSEVEHLREGLAAHAAVDQARGILMVVHGVDADAAWQLLEQTSSRCNIKVRRLSEALVGMAAARPTGDRQAADVAVQQLLRPAAADRVTAEFVARLVRRGGSPPSS